MPKTQTIFEITPGKRTVIIHPRGDATGFQDVDISRELERVLEYIAASEPLSVVIDLSGSNYYGSVMIGAVNSIGDQVIKRGGKMVLAQGSADMVAILQVMQLIPRWEHYETLKDAEKALV